MFKPFKPAFGSPVMGNRGNQIVKPKTLNFTIDGNSLSALGDSYVNTGMLQTRIKSNYALTLRNFAVSGQQTPAMSSDASTQIDVPAHLDKGYNILLAWEITNHVEANNTAAAGLAAIKAYCLARKAYGFKVIVGNTISRGAIFNGGQTVADMQARLAACDILVREQWRDFADAFIDFAADPYLGGLTAFNNTTYFNTDKVHLVTEGNKIVADYVSAAVNSFLP